MLDSATILEWVGTILGLAGAYLLAFNVSCSRWGWLGFFLANLATMSFALMIGRYGLFVQQAGFVGSSLIGMYRVGLFSFLSAGGVKPRA
jgi:hypothetical protein